MARLEGCEVPRIWTPPLVELAPETSLGFSVIDFATNILKMELFPWQRWFLIHALELRDGGGFRFRTVLLLISRQNGKSTIAQVLALWFLFVFQCALVIGTAQSLDTSEETWAGAVAMAEDCEQLSGEIERVVRVNGKKALEVSGGGAYKVAACSRRGARGKTGDVVILDELREHLNWEAWGAVTKTTNARPNAMILCMSNAGDAFSVVLRHLRYQAHMALGDPDGWCASVGDSGGAGETEDDSLGIFEWSAVPGCDMADREQWAQANPSLGYTISERALKASLATDPERVFRPECLCQWVETVREEPFPEGAWEAGTDERSYIPEPEPVSFGIDVSGDRAWTSIAVCGRRADGKLHIEVVARRNGLGWAVKWLTERADKAYAQGRPFRFAYQKRGAPVSSIADLLGGIGHAEPYEVEGRDLASWCGRLWDGVSACLPDSESDATPVMHRPQPVLDMAAKVAATKPLGDSAWVFDRSKSPEDVAPLMACAMALGLHEVPEEKAPESAYSEERGLMFI